VLITHDESIFYQNDQWQVYWGCLGKNIVPRTKGEGLTLMVSDFLTADWGPLHDEGRCVINLFSLSNCSPFPSKARIIFWPGKNRDGWFTSEHLLAQVDHAIDIFEGITGGYVSRTASEVD
jgi:hypothetical protein